MTTLFGYKLSIPTPSFNKTALLVGGCAFLSQALAHNISTSSPVVDQNITSSSTGEALGNENAWLPPFSYALACTAFVLSCALICLTVRKMNREQNKAQETARKIKAQMAEQKKSSLPSASPVVAVAVDAPSQDVKPLANRSLSYGTFSRAVPSTPVYPGRIVRSFTTSNSSARHKASIPLDKIEVRPK